MNFWSSLSYLYYYHSHVVPHGPLVIAMRHENLEWNFLGRDLRG